MNRLPASIRCLCLALALGGGASAQSVSDGPLRPLIEHVKAHPNGEAAWSIDLSALRGDRSSLPIGVFDSGIGGLTVMEAILTLDAFDNRTLQAGADGIPDFAGERFIYFGDQANMPYGNYPAQGKEGFLRELILKDAVFLLGRRAHERSGGVTAKPPVKAIVIACNTATAFGLDDLRAALRAWSLDVPVIGVVEAGARAVAEHLPNQAPGTVAVLATVGTCASNAYPKTIGRVAGLAGKPVPTILQQGSVGLAGAIEGNPAFVSTSAVRPVPYLGPRSDPNLGAAYRFESAGLLGDAANAETLELNSPANYARYDVTTLLERYREAGGGPPIKTVVLGCTHFPIIQSDIAKAFDDLRHFRSSEGAQPYRELIAAEVEFVSPAEFTAKELFRELARGHLRATAARDRPPAIAAAYVSVPNASHPAARLAADGAFDSAYKYGRETGRLDVEDFLCVPIADAALPLESLAGLARALPVTWKQLSLEKPRK